ncbi:response regulator [Thiorhodococcus fuscus]|uniref:Response regulator n=1 Tax=Thiorhodococcus fuscus TaxID=527200 RepID=A0ABW4YC24_9GAMM
MMPKKSTFTIMLLGLKESERRVLKSLCMLSGNRPRSYKIVSAMDADHADFWVVDGRDATALASLRSARMTRQIPVMVVDPSDFPDEYDASIGRPIVASRLLSAFDLLVGKTLGETSPLPAGEAVPPAPVPKPASNGVHDAPLMDHGRRHTALVVDDSLTIRTQVELALREHAVEATCAETAEAAMALLATRYFDVIFLDVVLPGGMDGYQICRSIKKSGVHKRTPVIMLTGKSSPFDRVRGSLAGCDTYLVKPVESNTFTAILKKYLKAPEVAIVG